MSKNYNSLDRKNKAVAFFWGEPKHLVTKWICWLLKRGKRAPTQPTAICRPALKRGPHLTVIRGSNTASVWDGCCKKPSHSLSPSPRSAHLPATGWASCLIALFQCRVAEKGQRGEESGLLFSAFEELCKMTLTCWGELHQPSCLWNNLLVLGAARGGRCAGCLQEAVARGILQAACFTLCPCTTNFVMTKKSTILRAGVSKTSCRRKSQEMTVAVFPLGLSLCYSSEVLEGDLSCAQLLFTSVLKCSKLQ